MLPASVFRPAIAVLSLVLVGAVLDAQRRDAFVGSRDHAAIRYSTADTHDPVAASYADRILFLADGRLVAEKPRQSADEISRFMLGMEVAA